MVSINDVDPQKLNEELTKTLKGYKEIQPPEWAQFVKTGAHKERPPVSKDWWWIRSASVLRTIYKKGPIGVSKLRSKYGGAKNRGVKPHRFTKSSGSIIRYIFQQLDAAKLTKKEGKNNSKGRIITSEGQKILDNTANKILSKSKVLKNVEDGKSKNSRKKK